MGKMMNTYNIRKIARMLAKQAKYEVLKYGNISSAVRFVFQEECHAQKEMGTTIVSNLLDLCNSYVFQSLRDAKESSYGEKGEQIDSASIFLNVSSETYVLTLVTKHLEALASDREMSVLEIIERMSDCINYGIILDELARE